MGVASEVSRGSGVIGWAAADLHWMVTEVGVAFSCRLLSVTVGEELGERSVVSAVEEGLDLYSEMQSPVGEHQ